MSDGGSHALAYATLITWVVTAGIGAWMLRTLIARGGLRRQRARPGALSPLVLFAHFTLALTALSLWAGYVATGWVTLAWLAVALLMPAIGLGISTVTLWTPYPDTDPVPDTGPAAGSGPAAAPAPSFPAGMLSAPAQDAMAGRLTDEVLASAVSDEALMSRLVEEVVAGVRADPVRTGRRHTAHLAAFLPVIHGLAALATFLLAVVSAATAT